jgi:hypothetical protein
MAKVLETIYTRVERVVYPKDGAAGEFFILACDCGTCKGTLQWRPDANEKLGMRGEWVSYQGKRQFAFKEVWHDLPKDDKALLHYACELTSGIGPAMEAKIWDKLGAGWQSVSYDDIPGLKGATLNNLKDTIAKLGLEKEKTEAVAWLISVGCSRLMSEKAWAKWDVETVGTVKKDCFILAELPNYGFTDIDNGIRVRFGIGDLDERRIRAAVVYYMRQLADGPTVVSWWELRDKIMYHLRGLPVSNLAATTAALINDGTLVGFPEAAKLSLAADFEDEKMIFDYVNKDNKVTEVTLV